MESEDELPSLSSASRAPRGLTLIALSILTIAVAGIAYLHPSVGFASALQPGAASTGHLPASYQVAAVDFVTPTTGWVVAELGPHDFAVLHTSDAGKIWSRQLSGSAGVLGEYVRFFDSAHGVLVPLGPQAALYQTSDGGTTWSRHPLTQSGGEIWSADFVDPNHGWLLAPASTEAGPQKEALLRTEDGGRTWAGLGDPVLSRDWAYSVAFADSSHGWLYSQSAGPYAYKSDDGGTTWHRSPLPAPAASVLTGTFFVAAHPTLGAGVETTVIGDPSPNSGSTHVGVSLAYPPLSVRTFEGGGSVTYVYADVSPYRYSSIEYVNPGALVDTEPANQFQLSSIDGGLSWKAILIPSTYGAVGYVNALNWWWIGSGAQSTSSDAGGTWTQARSMGVPEPVAGTLQFLDSTHAWFGAMAGTRPLMETTDDGGVDWTKILLPAITP
jgi:photosystem II stability/assembly factor-like uncharacterized protein